MLYLQFGSGSGYFTNKLNLNKFSFRCGSSYPDLFILYSFLKQITNILRVLAMCWSATSTDRTVGLRELHLVAVIAQVILDGFTLRLLRYTPALLHSEKIEKCKEGDI